MIIILRDTIILFFFNRSLDSAFQTTKVNVYTLFPPTPHRCGKVAAKLRQSCSALLQRNYAATIYNSMSAPLLHGNVAATIHRHCAATMQHRNQVQGCCNHPATLPQRSVLYG